MNLHSLVAADLQSVGLTGAQPTHILIGRTLAEWLCRIDVAGTDFIPNCDMTWASVHETIAA